MLPTRFTELVGCSVPIQLAGMGNAGNPRLAAAVTAAGGLGTVSVYDTPPAVVADALGRLRSQLTGPLCANVILHFVAPGDVEPVVTAAAARARVVDFFYTDPDPALVALVHEHGALASWQVGSREEALAAEAAGCDLLIAQGTEAGGHVRGTVGVLALLDEVLEAVDVPVLAAGGVASGRTLAAVLAAGADGARIGTRLLAAEEADAHPVYLDALVAARAQDTVHTEAFGGGWPVTAPHRLLRSCVAAAEAFEGEVVGEAMHALTGERYPVARFGCDGVNAGFRGEVAAMSLWAGEGVGRVVRVQPAAEIVRDLVVEAEALLRRWDIPAGAGR
jgi:NAD(P)H-dependent flavin oxidoreductase YrpB (nitropropane dioxygenase family)